MENTSDEHLYTLTLVGNVRHRTGRVKLVAKNVAGEVTIEASLSISGSPPTFAQNPYISEVLEGLSVPLELVHVLSRHDFSKCIKRKTLKASNLHICTAILSLDY